MQTVFIAGTSTKHYSAEIVGAKAANLAHMASLGVPVPPAFVLPISLCAAIVAGNAEADEKLAAALADGIGHLEKTTGLQFGDRRRPLLVSVRSGAARSMPGMLDTVLDVGCTPAAVHGLVRMTGNQRFAYDCRCRFLESYGDVVMGLDMGKRAASPSGFDSEDVERLAASLQQTIEDEDETVPDDPMAQLEAAARAVYRSWMSPRAATYRRLQQLEDLEGTAVTVQAMVFGNRNRKSGAGVAFSRDPSTGVAEPVIDVVFEAQGEDVVSGRRTPEPEDAIRRSAPQAAVQLRETLVRLEREFADVQDVEFTIEDDKLWILQTRSAKRTPLAALKFAVALVKEKLISPQQALLRLNDIDLHTITHRRLADSVAPVARGIGASAGVAVGRVAFDSESAQHLSDRGDNVILVRPDTSTADVAGFAASAGIVTAVGGRTAHAALVARQMGKPCIVGCADLSVDVANRSARFGQTVIKAGDWLSIDAETGAIYLGRIVVIEERPDAELAEVERWRNQNIELSSGDCQSRSQQQKV